MSFIVFSSVLAGLATCFGSIIVIFFGKPNYRTLAFFLGLAAGIMAAVVIFDLLPSALKYGSLTGTTTGFLFGLLIICLFDYIISSYYPASGIKSDAARHFFKMGILIAVGIAFHDLPEGFAITAGYWAQERLGLFIALAIGLHNIPEGMAASAPLKMGGMNSFAILGMNLMVSFFTPLGTLLGFAMVNISSFFIAWLMAIAAGTMSYIVFKELLPESLKHYPLNSFLGASIGTGLIIYLTFYM